MKKNTVYSIIVIFAMVMSVYGINPGDSGSSAPDLYMSESLALSINADKNRVDSYVILMKGLPVIAYEGGVAGLEATAPAYGEKIDMDSLAVMNYVGYLQSQHASALLAVGAKVTDKVYDYYYSLNGFTAQLTYNQAALLNLNENVLSIGTDEFKYADTDSSPDFLGLSNRGGAWDSGYTGEDVVIGVIDTGIWPEHPSFADDGTYGPLDPLDFESTADNPCEFGNDAHNPDDAAFTCNNKLVAATATFETYRALIGIPTDAFDSARDENGHGTHTASTAGGNADVEATVLGINRGKVSGLAPRARISAYKALGPLGGFGSDLAAAIDQAVADGVDVINYSIGGGASVPTGPDDIAFLFAANAGVFVATSAGNSGDGPNTVGSPGNAPWVTTVGASSQDRSFVGKVTIGGHWWKGQTFYGVSITAGVDKTQIVDAEDHGGDLCEPGTLDSGVTGKIVLCARGAIARVAKSQAVLEAGGVGMVLYEVDYDGDQMSDSHSVPTVHVNTEAGLAIKAYIDEKGDEAVAKLKGGRARNTREGYMMTSFSSRGPNGPVPDVIKPDITAPGIQILAGNTPYGTGGELFQAIAGTSMSSPHIAGIFGLLAQAHPDWSPAMAKSALMTTATQDVVKNDGVTPADPFDMGAGHVNTAFDRRSGIEGSFLDPGLVYDAGLFEYAAFTCGADLGVFSPGSCDFLEGIGVPTDASDLNLPSIGIAKLAGSQTVVRTVTSVGPADEERTFRVDVESPQGFEVSVSPSVITLSGGESVTYEVTITSTESASTDDWTFGSLTWSDRDDDHHRGHSWSHKHHKRDEGTYKVYSPIAVKAALFSTPEEVFGADGSATFDVSFGYTGEYTAEAWGFASHADARTVDQDPDQTFDPNDHSGTNLHEVEVPAGTPFVRFALYGADVGDPTGATDLDMFVFGPDGTMVGSSTRGGTEYEDVSLILPAAGTYSVFVHGWGVATVSGSVDYVLYDYVVANQDDTMHLDSAPASAIVGTAGTINLSWAGLAPGERFLGVVVHRDAGGVMGVTVVFVET